MCVPTLAKPHGEQLPTVVTFAFVNKLCYPQAPLLVCLCSFATPRGYSSLPLLAQMLHRCSHLRNASATPVSPNLFSDVSRTRLLSRLVHGQYRDCIVKLRSCRFAQVLSQVCHCINSYAVNHHDSRCCPSWSRLFTHRVL